jgi:hypothetical protein
VFFVPFVVKSVVFFVFGCGFAALGPLWLNFFSSLVAVMPGYAVQAMREFKLLGSIDCSYIPKNSVSIIRRSAKTRRRIAMRGTNPWCWKL